MPEIADQLVAISPEEEEEEEEEYVQNTQYMS